MQEPKVVSSFYKYVNISNAPEFVNEHLAFCKSLRLKGRIMIGEEGINGCVCGAESSVEKYKQKLKSMPIFSDIDFKGQKTEKPAYRKLFVRLRKEIVNFGFKADLKNKGAYLSPAQLKKLLDMSEIAKAHTFALQSKANRRMRVSEANSLASHGFPSMLKNTLRNLVRSVFDKNEDVILVDMRNDYEAKIGKFKNAVVLDIKNFRDLPKAVNNIKHLKNKKIITYCTGGIRCEKASAFLIENGFKDVMQLHGGILKYGEKFPDTYWTGKCFVFDDRIAIGINQKNKEPLNECRWCGKKCDDYVNCHNLDCDKLFICCEECKIWRNASCSDECKNSCNRRKKGVEIETLSMHQKTKPI